MQNVFLVWLFQQRARNDPVGDLARDAFQDVEWNGKLKTLEHTTRGTDAEETFFLAISEFRAQRKKY